MKIANLVVEGNNIRQISDILFNHKDDFYKGEPHMYRDGDIVVLMREHYYRRVSSYIMSVIFMKFIDDNKVEIELVSSGGKEGVLMMDLGAEKVENRDIVNQIISVCSINSWEITTMLPEDLMESIKESTINEIKEKIVDPFNK